MQTTPRLLREIARNAEHEIQPIVLVAVSEFSSEVLAEILPVPRDSLHPGQFRRTPPLRASRRFSRICKEAQQPVHDHGAQSALPARTVRAVDGDSSRQAICALRARAFAVHTRHGGGERTQTPGQGEAKSGCETDYCRSTGQSRKKVLYSCLCINMRRSEPNFVRFLYKTRLVGRYLPHNSKKNKTIRNWHRPCSEVCVARCTAQSVGMRDAYGTKIHRGRMSICVSFWVGSAASPRRC